MNKFNYFAIICSKVLIPLILSNAILTLKWFAVLHSISRCSCLWLQQSRQNYHQFTKRPHCSGEQSVSYVKQLSALNKSHYLLVMLPARFLYILPAHIHTIYIANNYYQVPRTMCLIVLANANVTPKKKKKVQVKVYRKLIWKSIILCHLSLLW